MFTDNLMVSKIIYQKDGYIFILCSKFVVALSATLLHLKKIKLSTVSLFNVKEVVLKGKKIIFARVSIRGLQRAIVYKNSVKNNCTMAF